MVKTLLLNNYFFQKWQYLEMVTAKVFLCRIFWSGNWCVQKKKFPWSRACANRLPQLNNCGVSSCFVPNPSWRFETQWVFHAHLNPPLDSATAMRGLLTRIHTGCGEPQENANSLNFNQPTTSRSGLQICPEHLCFCWNLNWRGKGGNIQSHKIRGPNFSAVVCKIALQKTGLWKNPTLSSYSTLDLLPSEKLCCPTLWENAPSWSFLLVKQLVSQIKKFWTTVKVKPCDRQTRSYNGGKSISLFGRALLLQGATHVVTPCAVCLSECLSVCLSVWLSVCGQPPSPLKTWFLDSSHNFWATLVFRKKNWFFDPKRIFFSSHFCFGGTFLDVLCHKTTFQTLVKIIFHPPPKKKKFHAHLFPAGCTPNCGWSMSRHNAAKHSSLTHPVVDPPKTSDLMEFGRNTVNLWRVASTSPQGLLSPIARPPGTLAAITGMFLQSNCRTGATCSQQSLNITCEIFPRALYRAKVFMRSFSLSPHRIRTYSVENKNENQSPNTLKKALWWIQKQSTRDFSTCEKQDWKTWELFGNLRGIATTATENARN